MSTDHIDNMIDDHYAYSRAWEKKRELIKFFRSYQFYFLINAMDSAEPLPPAAQPAASGKERTR